MDRKKKIKYLERYKETLEYHFVQNEVLLATLQAKKLILEKSPEKLEKIIIEEKQAEEDKEAIENILRRIEFMIRELAVK